MIFFTYGAQLLAKKDDDFLIDLAVEANADFIITYNQKDLQVASLFGIKVVNNNEFLQQVGEIQ